MGGSGANRKRKRRRRIVSAVEDNRVENVVMQMIEPGIGGERRRHATVMLREGALQA